MHKHITLRPWYSLIASADHAILEAYKELARRAITTILLADQGGWLTYKDYAKKTGLSIHTIQTDDGIINPHDIPALQNSALIINSLAAYTAPQPMRAISERCTALGITLINDVSGSIGTAEATYGDIILGSFGKDKPVNAHYGGFIAADTPIAIEHTFDDKHRPLILHHLDLLDSRLAFLHRVHQQIKHDLAALDIVHRDAQGINVIVKFHTPDEKKRILEYCEKHAYPVTLCPREIRILSPAISIEVKRLTK